VADDREPYGRLVHDTRLACEADRAAAEGRQRFDLPPWEERDDWQRELDMRIGSAVAARAVDDAGFDQSALAAEIIRLRSRLDSVVDEVCKRIARICEEEAGKLVPSDERNAWLSAAGVALAVRERNDKKGWEP
jgi:hypothetical protein